MHRVHIVLKEFKAVALMLCRMAFLLSGKVVTLHLHNRAAKAHLCNQGDNVFFFPD